MTERDQNTDGLDALFQQAKEADRASVSPDLMARVLADAEALQPKPGAEPVAPNRPGLFAQLSSALGGWPSLTGLAAATAAGIWVGFVASPDALPGSVANLVGNDSDIYLAYFDGGTGFELEEQ